MHLINTRNMERIKPILVKVAWNEEDLTVWTELMWLSMNSNAGWSKYSYVNETLFVTKKDNFRLVKQLLALQE